MALLYNQKNDPSTAVNILTAPDYANHWYKPKLSECDRVSQLIRPFDNGRADRIFSCGHYLELKAPIENDLPRFDKSKLNSANFCRDRLCPMCAWRLYVRNYANLLKVTEVLKYGGNNLVFLTLTIPNCKGEKLKENIEYIKESLVRLRRLKAFKNAFNGYFLKLEVTYNKEKDEYHPHVHLLLSADSDYYTNRDKYITTEQLVKLWGSCTDELLFAYNRRNHTDLKGFLAYFEKVDDEIKGIKELAKYSVKSFEVTQDSIDTFAYELNGVRLITYYGSFNKVHHKLKLDDEKLTDDMREDVDYILSRLKYDRELGQYVQITGGVTYEQKNGSFEGCFTKQYCELEYGPDREYPTLDAADGRRLYRTLSPGLCENQRKAQPET